MYVIPLEDPQGIYTITATQGNLAGQAVFRLVYTDEDRFEMNPIDMAVGSEVFLYLSGFPANRRVLLHWYSQVADSGFYSYWRSMSVDTNQNGQGTYHFFMNADPGNYVLVADHPTQRDPRAWFTVNNNCLYCASPNTNNSQ